MELSWSSGPCSVDLSYFRVVPLYGQFLFWTGAIGIIIGLAMFISSRFDVKKIKKPRVSYRYVLGLSIFALVTGWLILVILSSASFGRPCPLPT